MPGSVLFTKPHEEMGFLCIAERRYVHDPEGNRTRAVAFSDVTGDRVPEMVFMEGEINNGIRMHAVLNVVTCQNGDIKTLHRSEGWDVNPGD